MKHLCAALAILAAVGPGGGSAAQQRSAGQAHALEELVRAERTWRASKIEAYEFRFQYACGMVPPPSGPSPILIRVDNRQSTLPAPGPGVPVAAELDRYSTVEKLFGFIREAWTRHPARVDAQYDQARGYPIRVCVDPVANVSDDEFGFVIADFSVSDGRADSGSDSPLPLSVLPGSLPVFSVRWRNGANGCADNRHFSCRVPDSRSGTQ